MTRPKQRPAKRRFYAQALTEAERAELPAALRVEGVDEEIAALRLRLRTAMGGDPEMLALVVRGMDVLRRLVVAQYGLSRADEEALQTAFAAETERRIKERGEGGGGVDVA